MLFSGKSQARPAPERGLDKFYTSLVLKSASAFFGKGDLEEEFMFPVVLSSPLYRALFVCDSAELLVSSHD